MSPRALLLATAAFFATGGTAIKLTTLPGLQVAGLRSLIAGVFLLVVVPGARRGWTRSTLLVGVSYAACLVLFVIANKLTTAAHAIFLQSTSVLWVVLLSPWLLGERPARRDLVALVTVGLGMALMVSSGERASATATAPLLGNLVAAGSGLFWAGTGLGLRWLSTHAGPDEDPTAAAAAAPAVGNFLAFGATLPFMGLPHPAGLDLLVLGWLGVFQVGVSYWLLTRAIPHVPALEAALVLLLEPVLSAVLAAVVHGEHPSPQALVGAVIMLAGLGAHAWMAPRDPSTA